MILLYLICITLASLTSTAAQDRLLASNALNEFAFRILGIINNNVQQDTNVALSPYTIWTALSVVAEGARGNTSVELDRALGIPPSKDFRAIFTNQQQAIIKSLARKKDGAQLEILNTIFTKLDAKLKKEFQTTAQEVYNVIVEPVNFTDVRGTADHINKRLSDATHGRFPQIVNEDAIQNADMFVASALHFRGLWDKKFDKDDTRDGRFYDENQVPIATVSMMYNSGNFPYARILNERATAIELPYKGDTMSMIVMLPNRGVSLREVIMAQAETPLRETLGILAHAREAFLDATVVVTLPKFTLSSDLVLNDILQRMNIHDAFGEKANLTGIADGQLYISRISHKAQIEIDEEGSVGSAVTLVELMDRIQAPVFNANRPFAFFIVDKTTHTTLLMGMVRKPK